MKGFHWLRGFARKTSVRIVGGLIVLLILFGLFGYFALPGIIRSQAEKLLTQELHRPVTIERISVSPYKLAVTVHQFKLMEPDGKTVFASFDKFRASLSPQSVLALSPVIRKLKLTNPYVRITRDRNGKLNIDDLLAPSDKPPSTLTARIGIQTIDIVGGSFAYDDHALPQPIDAAVQKFHLNVKELAIDLGKREIAIDEIASDSASYHVIHHKTQPLARHAVQTPHKTPQHAQPADEKPFAASIGKVAIQGWSAKFEDRNVSQPVVTAVSHFGLTAQHLSSNLSQKSALDLNATINQSGTVHVSGQVAVSPLQADLKVRIQNIDIAGLQPYFPNKVNVRLTEAKLSTDTAVKLREDKAGKLNGSVNGKATVASLATVDKASEKNLLRWKSLDADGIHMQLAPFSLTIDQLTLSEFFVRIVVDETGRFNLQDVILDEPSPKPRTAPPPKNSAQQNADADNAEKNAASTEAEKPKTDAKAADAPATHLPAVRINKLVLDNGRVRFTDNYIKPHYTAKATQFSGVITGLSSDEASTATVDLRGRVNEAPLLVSGRINPLKKDLFLDLKAEVHGMELAPLSTYASKYTGYGIESGQLSFEVAYKIENRQIEANNRLILNQLTFSDDVEDTEAAKLPVRLAASLLSDRDGVIDIELPIGGSLDDPEFSVGGIIAKALVNMIGKAITSPFSLLASAFGGSGTEDLGWLAFAPGQSVIAAQSEEKLSKLAEALANRPSLKLSVTGYADPATDKEGLTHVYLQRKLRAQKIKNMGSKGKDIPFNKVNVSAAEYPVLLRQVYRAETPFSLGKLVGKQNNLPIAAIEKELIDKIKITDEDLKALGNQRAMATKEWLITKGRVPTERVIVHAGKLTSKAADATEEPAKAGRVEFSVKD